MLTVNISAQNYNGSLLLACCIFARPGPAKLKMCCGRFFIEGASASGHQDTKEPWQGFDNRWTKTAADRIIRQTNNLDDLMALAPDANNQQILGMILRLNTWPKLTAEDLIDWVSKLKDQSLASRVLQDQTTGHRYTNGELVDAYNQLGDTPVKNWIIDILRQRNPSMNEWNEIYLRSKEGSRLMTLAAIGSLRCDQ
jgi:hypothetical protein